MRTVRIIHLCAFLMLSAESGFADGKVFARPDVRAEVEIPNQQALIYHGNGIERLVIETAFLGEGTNFAWVVPLPGVPKVQPVSENFFPSLSRAFQPRLLHYVHHYYIGVLFVCGLAFLAWRSLKDERVWVVDLPLCLLMAAGAGLLQKSVLFGSLTLAFMLGARLFVRTSTNFALVVLAGMLLAAWTTAFNNMQKWGLIDYLGSQGAPTAGPDTDVKVLSIQRAGVFQSTTIRGSDPRAILDWLATNGFVAPKAIEPVIADYVKRGWVFVASKAAREGLGGGVASLHPLAFSFATATPLYPMKLTGVDNGECAVDLYVFGSKRAAASHFYTARCDRVAKNMPDEPTKLWKSWLRIQDAEVSDCISNASVGTKLSVKLTPPQMKADVDLTWRQFSANGTVVFSDLGASTIALNIAVPVAVFGWLLIGTCRGGWGVDEQFVSRWRLRIILAAIIIGLAVYLVLPKVAVVES